MASGLEMMFKSLGIDLNAIKAEYENILQGLRKGLQSVDNNMAEIKRLSHENNSRLKRIELHLGIKEPDENPDIEVIPPPRIRNAANG